MFERFKKHFAGSQEMNPDDFWTLDAAPSEMLSFLREFAGWSFRHGLYRVLVPASVPKWTEVASATFPEFRGRIRCFGYDWLGRFFAVEFSRLVKEEPAVLMLEPGTGEALEIPCGFADFHNYELVDHTDAVLASGFFADWLRIANTSPKYAQCVGYKRPLYLGGEDSVKNLELVDMEVYWGLSAQLLAQTRALPIGTKIGQVKLG